MVAVLTTPQWGFHSYAAGRPPTPIYFSLEAGPRSVTVPLRSSVSATMRLESSPYNVELSFARNGDGPCPYPA